MQTDRGIYHKRVCDRCGAVLGGRMMNPDEYFKDWAWRRDTGFDFGDSCDYETWDAFYKAVCKEIEGRNGNADI